MKGIHEQPEEILFDGYVLFWFYNMQYVVIKKIKAFFVQIIGNHEIATW